MISQLVARALGFFSLLFVLALPAHAAVTGRDVVLENGKDLVVMIEGTVGDSRQEGAGLIVGSDHDALYIVTADHVVREGDQSAAGLAVRFRWRSDQSVPATLLPTHIPRSEVSNSKIYDLALLRVPRTAVPAFDLDLLPLEQVGAVSALKRADELYFLGYPQGKAWYGNVTPAKFAEADGDLVTFESDALLPGYSGGALLNSNLQLVGLIIDTEGTFGTAINIAAVIAALDRWKTPAQIDHQPKNIRFSALSAGYETSCGLSEKGFAYCWSGGAGPTGKDKDDTEEWRQLGRLAGGLRFASFAVGPYHTCGITVSGEAYCFGSDDKGQLGNSTTEDYSAFPEPVSGNLRFRAISAGESHSCGLTTDGRAYCWGEGWEDHPVPVRTSETFDAISSGEYFSCALSKGRAWCWGDNDNGQLGREGDIRATSYVPVPVPMDATLSLKQLSSGFWHTCAISSDDRVVCWGNNDYGQAGAVDQVRAAVLSNQRFLSVTAGDESTCGISIDHRALCWGNASYGALGAGWTKVIKNEVIEDEIHKEPVPVGGGHKFEALSAGHGFFACGFTDDQQVLCWGRRHRRLRDFYGDYGTTPHSVNH